jgi:LPXTG-site transpeptidase (sortase) family protein
MSTFPRWLRRAEIAFWVLGISLLGVAVAAVVDARVYQARQERAFSILERSAVPAKGAAPLEASDSDEPPLGFPADPLVLGMIEIPRIGLSAIVREGDDDETLRLAVGHVPGTAAPGVLGNMVLAGHRDTFFRALRLVRLHDTIQIRTAGRRYDYRVDSTEIVAPEETRVLEPTSSAVLTLVTCYPFGWIGNAPRRFVVRASPLP